VQRPGNERHAFLNYGTLVLPWDLSLPGCLEVLYVFMSVSSSNKCVGIRLYEDMS